MGFQQGLSGLNVSAKSLDAIGNNIANSSTVGFKSSAVQFADVYAASLGGGGAGQIGIGASAPSIAQLFTQGNVTTTNNPLDLAINGGGFYRLSDSGTPLYSRNGQFSLDKDGYIVNSSGLRLTGYGVDDVASIVPGDFVDLRLSTTNIEPSATTSSEVVVNLDSRTTPPASMTSGALTGSAAPVTTIVGGNNTLDLDIDGITATVDVPLGTYTYAELRTQLEDAINNNPTFAGVVSVTVGLANDNSLIITSDSVGTIGSQGLGSYVDVTGGDGLVPLLGPTAPTPTAASDGFTNPPPTNAYTASTAQTVYDSLGNPHNLTMYFAKTSQLGTWQVYTAMDGVFTGTAVNIPNAFATLQSSSYVGNAATTGDQFTITIDGSTVTATLPAGGPFADETALAAAVQSAIDTAFLPAASPATVAAVGGGGLLVTSTNYGGAISVDTATLAGATIFGGALTSVPGTLASTTIDPDPTLMRFDNNGALTSGSQLQLTFPSGTGAADVDFLLDFTGSSQYGINFGVNQLLQDGYTSGRLTGISVAADGTVQGRYSNGKTRNQGQVILVNFNSPNGLQSLGNNVWGETAESGQPIPGTPGQGSLGLIQAAAVEESNVDLTAELVNMITQQRVYQANAQTIKTQDQILQTLVNLR